MFSKQIFKNLFCKFEVVKLYTDGVPEEYYPTAVRKNPSALQSRQSSDAAINIAFQTSVFNDEKLPLYVILEPLLDDRIHIEGIYAEGRINNEVEFMEFLQKPLRESGTGGKGS